MNHQKPDNHAAVNKTRQHSVTAPESIVDMHAKSRFGFSM